MEFNTLLSQKTEFKIESNLEIKGKKKLADKITTLTSADLNFKSFPRIKTKNINKTPHIYSWNSKLI